MSSTPDALTITDASGAAWHVVDVWQADVPRPKRVGADERGYAGARMFVSADGRTPRVVRVYFFQSPVGGFQFEADERRTDAALLASQLAQSRPWTRGR